MVYQFEWDESANDWKELRALCSSDSDQRNQGNLGNNFGNNQALAIRGETILVGDLGADIANEDDSGRVYYFATTPLTTFPGEVTRDAFFEDLANNASGKHLPTDDADGDGHSNLKEFYAGTNPMSPIKDTALQWTRSDTFPDKPSFSFLQSKANIDVYPRILMSHTLEPDSWTTLEAPRYLPDTRMDNSIRKTIDLSHLLSMEQPVFLKIDYPEID
jgi:hypothetical protein